MLSNELEVLRKKHMRPIQIRSLGLTNPTKGLRKLPHVECLSYFCLSYPWFAFETPPRIHKGTLIHRRYNKTLVYTNKLTKKEKERTSSLRLRTLTYFIGDVEFIKLPGLSVMVFHYSTLGVGPEAPLGPVLAAPLLLASPDVEPWAEPFVMTGFFSSSPLSS